MELFNRTKLPSNLVVALLRKAAEFVGVETDNIACKIVGGTKRHTGTYCYDRFQANQHGWKTTPTGSHITGWMTIRTPFHSRKGIYGSTATASHKIEFARQFYGIMVHEFQHAYDHSQGNALDRDRNKPYRERSHEKRAFQKQEDALALIDQDPELKTLVADLQDLVNSILRWQVGK